MEEGCIDQKGNSKKAHKKQIKSYQNLENNMLVLVDQLNKLTH